MLSSYIHVLAGKEKLIEGKHPHNLIIAPNGLSMLENTLEQTFYAHENMPQTKIISTIKSCPESLREKYGWVADILVSRKELIQSAQYAIMEGIINGNYKGTEHEFRGAYNLVPSIRRYIEAQPFEIQEEIRDLTVMYVASDSPFINAKDLLRMRSNYIKAGSPDIFVGLTDMEKIYGMGDELGVDLRNLSTIKNHSIIDGGKYRLSNMFIIKPIKVIEQGLTRPFQFMYNNRYISENKYLKLLFMVGVLAPWLTAISPSKRSAPSFFTDIGYLMAHVTGSSQEVSIDSEKAAEKASRFLGLELKLDLEGGKTVLDADDEPSVKIFRENFKRINEYQLLMSNSRNTSK